MNCPYARLTQKVGQTPRESTQQRTYSLSTPLKQRADRAKDAEAP
jgi:hypothetical protein